MSPRVRLVAWVVTHTGALACLPWFAVLLQEAGTPAALVPLALLAVPLASLLGGPLWSSVADLTGRGRAVLRGAALLQGLVGPALLIAPHSGTWLTMGLALVAFSRAPLSPLGDALIVRLLGPDRRSYGAIRAWGSVGFLVVMWLAGTLRVYTPLAPLWLGAGLMVISAVLAFVLPDVAAPSTRPDWRTVAKLLAHPVLLPLLAVAVLHGVTITTYDNLFSMHVEALGHSSAITGTAIALGVAVEVAVLAAGRTLLSRFGPARLLLVAVATGLPRWWITGATDDAVWLVLTQGLHGLGFGAFWIAGVAMLSEEAPDGVATSAQALLPAAAFGVGTLLSMGLASVVLTQADTSTLFLLLSAVSAVATGLTALTVRTR